MPGARACPKFYCARLKKQIIIIGDSPVTEELADYLNNNPQIGYSAKIKKLKILKILTMPRQLS